MYTCANYLMINKKSLNSVFIYLIHRYIYLSSIAIPNWQSLVKIRETKETDTHTNAICKRGTSMSTTLHVHPVATMRFPRACWDYC